MQMVRMQGGLGSSLAGARNYARSTLLLGALTALVVVVADAFGGPSWAVMALAIMAAINFGSWWFSDKVL